MRNVIYMICILFLAEYAYGSEEIYLMCDFEKYTDFISLKSPKMEKEDKYFSEGTWMRSSFNKTEKLKFKYKSNCYLNCVSAERYSILATQHLYRNTLKLVDNLKGINGAQPDETQCRIVTKEKWDAEISKIGSSNKI